MNQFLPGPKMVFIPGGTFRLDPHLSKLKRRVVTVGDFWMDETPVTVVQYLEAVKAGACSPPDDKNKYPCSNWEVEGRENHPVNCIDWYQAEAYAKWAGKRLPTEEEWEWAARGGSEARAYPWGNEPPSDQLCWHRWGRGKPNSTSPVGSYPKGNSKHGLKDMAGNVWEWTASVHHPYYYPALEHRAVKGGSWDECTTTYTHLVRNQESKTPDYGCIFVGFRCVRSA